ncbi:MAG TPA: 50S ribosomal protein L23 [Dehalococcoidia bacterium]|nr:50S ribosomal protein L23 [Dehalococcoidia bacterium]
MHLYEVLRRPLVTEKNAVLQMEGKYAFEVAGGATKPQIRQAVETAFKVKVTGVNVMTMPGKERRVGRRHVRTPSWKKAIVTLEPGNRIELFENV